MDVQWYKNKYDIFNMKGYDYDRIIEDFETDFMFELIQGYRKLHEVPFGRFRQCVFNLLGKINHLYECSQYRLDGNKIWVSIFNAKLNDLCFQLYPFRYDNSFLTLSFYFLKKDRYVVNNKPLFTFDIKEQLSFMNLNVNFTKNELDTKYRELCKIYHPDKGGSSEMFNKLHNCRLVLQNYLERKD